MKKNKILLIDGYLDEPSCLGVPPYISPHIRYIYGSLIKSGIKSTCITYQTIDSLREQISTFQFSLFDKIIIVAGTTVPGKYKGGRPISLSEIQELLSKVETDIIIAGPITLHKKNFTNAYHVCQEIAAIDIFEIFSSSKMSSDLEIFIRECSILGAPLTQKHPHYPYIICEIETFRGCPRSSHCTFCSEKLKKSIYQRKVSSIIEEISTLYNIGNLYFRLGCQTDILLFQAYQVKNIFTPNTEAIAELYEGIRKVAPNLKLLHHDNINPTTIADFQKESSTILKIITNYNTTGDIVSFGLESADPLVIKKNNIGTSLAKTKTAIEIVNEIGSYRSMGIPKLLPGINFLHGLHGENKNTYQKNYNFLKNIIESNLLLRRINIRQVIEIGNYKKNKINSYQFNLYKEKINKNINNPLLKTIFPAGTILHNVIIEEIKGETSYGRQLASYPILIRIPDKIPLRSVIDVRIIDHGFRSITAIPAHIKFEDLSLNFLKNIPGLGKKRAGMIKSNRLSLSHLRNVIDDINIIRYLDEIFSFHI